jgi:hypothetical protein
MDRGHRLLVLALDLGTRMITPEYVSISHLQRATECITDYKNCSTSALDGKSSHSSSQDGQRDWRFTPFPSQRVARYFRREGRPAQLETRKTPHQ